MKQLSSEQALIARQSIRWTLLVLPAAILTGSIIAFFLWSLDQATAFRRAHPYILYALPLAGIAIYLLYKHLGKNSEQGNNLIIEEIHQPGGGIPKRMAPLVLIGTLGTHLFGGSAGREGTAVQIGGTIAQWWAGICHLKEDDRRILLTTGIAAGFGAVFGTPVTGAIFAIEVLTIGRIQYNALLPCLIAAVVGNITCTAWNIHHTPYHILFTANVSAAHPLSFQLLASAIGAGIAFGLAGYIFATLTHHLKNTFHTLLPTPWLVPAAGGILIIALTLLLNDPSYLGLGVSSPNPAEVTIVSAFHAGGAHPWSWLWKLLFTAITLGAGFKGGEVTPLFYIGAALGNTIAAQLHLPVDLFAGLGFIAVFASATNTPLACTIMGVELFGSNNILYYAVACFTAYLFSGHSGIYTAQRIGSPKATSAWFSTDNTIQTAHLRRKRWIEQCKNNLRSKRPPTHKEK